ncbi:MAG: sigma-70 family RNA polymerase sigma factor [Vicinamibacterales bacterium]
MFHDKEVIARTCASLICRLARRELTWDDVSPKIAELTYGWIVTDIESHVRSPEPTFGHDVYTLFLGRVQKYPVTLSRQLAHARSAQAVLWTVARNVAFTLAKKHDRLRKREVFGKDVSATLSFSPSPEETLLHKEWQKRLARALQKLLPKERKLIWDWFIDEIPLPDIAAELRCSERAASSRIHRAKNKLDRIFNDLEQK